MKRYLFLFTILISSIIFSACTNPLAKKAKSGLQVQITNEENASVYLDGNYVEKTPFVNRELSPGEYTIKIQPDDPNLIPYETKISLKPGLLTVVTWKLAQRPEFSGGVIYEMEKINSKDNSEISFITIPDGAIVSVAGKEKTFSPVIIPEIIPGHVEFEVTLPSYDIQKHTINAIPGYRMLVTIKLAKENPSGIEQSATTIPQETTTLETQVQPQPQQILENTALATDTKDSSNSASVLSASTKQVKINSTNYFVDGKEVLRVRDLPGSTGKELGVADVGKLYTYLDKTENNWLNIEFNGKSGWVSKQYAQLAE